MAKPTLTRQQLRQQLCTELNMPFYRIFDAPQVCDTSSTTTITDAELSTFADDFWNNSWYYDSLNQTRLITDFVNSDMKATWVPAATALSAAASDAQTYELLNIFSPSEIHAAINRALQSGFPNFYDTAEDTSLVIQTGKLTYDLSALSPRPWSVTSVRIEHQADKIQGTVTSSTTSSLLDTAADFSKVKAGWMVSIYEGTGAGQVRTIAADGAVGITVNWTNNPDTTSKYCVWNILDENKWLPTLYVNFDTKEYPSALLLPQQFDRLLGARMKIAYLCKPEPMTGDSSVTPVPADYVINKAAAVLFSKKMNDNRVDRQRYQQLAAKYEQDADVAAMKNRFNLPEQSLWQEGFSDFYAEDSDPLGWG